jgi:hypothetical protein
LTGMLRCHEVTQLVASDAIAHAGLFRRLELRMHLLMCRHCRNYVRQIGLIGAGARALWGAMAPCEEDVAALEVRVLGALGHAAPPRPDDRPGYPPQGSG